MTHDMPGKIDLMLFVPAHRPGRFAKAAAAGADAIVVDLEDAVAAADKDAARDGLAAGLAGVRQPIVLRINGCGTQWHDADLRAARQLPLAAIMLPKAETAAEVAAVRAATGHPVVALVESARGICAAVEIARAADRLAFGSIDYAADVGADHEREALHFARSTLVNASRAEGRSGPLDGVTTAFDDPARTTDDARYASGLGMMGKLLIHPAQVLPARKGFATTDEDIAWAQRVLRSDAASGAVALDGAMIDAPVIKRAEAILRRVSTAGEA